MSSRPVPAPVRGRIAVVGPCASGKSELVERLHALGYDARHCAQEHSYVPDMWQRLSRPQALVYLDASLHVIATRRRIDYDAGYLETQRGRLAHARAHCDIHVDTDRLDAEGVLAVVVHELCVLGIGPTSMGDQGTN